METDLLNRVREKNIISKNAHVVLGLSGGPDSMCLFDVLMSLRDELDLKVAAVHVNHQIRPGAADEDQRFVEKVCRENDVPLTVVCVDCEAVARETGKTTEEAGRDARYEAFRKAAGKLKEEGADPRSIVIAVAHNADDQVETVLQRIIRGTGTDGLSGMRMIREDESGYPVVRPLLHEWKKDIVEYCERRGLGPRADHTNDEPLYLRNKIRLELLPLLEKFNPDVKNAILRLSESASQDAGMLGDMAERSYYENIVRKDRPDEKLSVVRLSTGITALQPAVARRVIRMALEDAGLKEDVTYAHYKAIDHIARSENPSAETELPGGYTVRREYEHILFVPPSEGLRKMPHISLRMIGIEEEAYAEGGSITAAQGRYALFDSSTLAEKYGESFSSMLEMRYRKPGDYIAIACGKKKVQDLFVDMKIPKHQRDSIPMCCIGNEVLFIPEEKGIMERARYSKSYGVSKDTKKAFLIEVIG